MKILALDCATTTGYACSRVSDSGLPITVCGLETFPSKRGESPGMRFLRFRQFLNGLVKLYKPELIVYEQAHHRGGAATEVCVGMTTRVQEVAAEYGLEHAAVHTAQLKKWATGKGNASKEEMQVAAASRFPYKAESDPGADKADALLLLAYATEKWGNGL